MHLSIAITSQASLERGPSTIWDYVLVHETSVESDGDGISIGEGSDQES